MRRAEPNEIGPIGTDKSSSSLKRANGLDIALASNPLRLRLPVKF